MKSMIALLLVITSLNVYANVVNPIKSTDPLEKTTKAIATTLADGNISTGTTSLSAGSIDKGQKFNTDLVKKAFFEKFKSQTDESFQTSAKLKVTVQTFVDSDVSEMTTALMESNAYDKSNSDLKAEQAKYLWTVLRKLPVNENTLIGHVKTKAMDSTTDELRTVEYFLVLGNDNKVVELFTIEGTM